MPTSDPTNIQYECMPVFAGISQNSSNNAPAIFPVSLLYKSPTVTDDPVRPTELDTNLFSHRMMPEANSLYNYAQSDNGSKPYNNDTFKNNPNNNM
jgi:hypothetical protein